MYSPNPNQPAFNEMEEELKRIKKKVNCKLEGSNTTFLVNQLLSIYNGHFRI